MFGKLCNDILEVPLDHANHNAGFESYTIRWVTIWYN